MSAAHTPGPWAVHNCTDKRCGWPQIIGPNDEDIVVSHSMMSCRIEAADARLIAAAPDLLEALVALLNGPDGKTGSEYGMVIAQGYAAIAKATGAAS